MTQLCRYPLAALIFLVSAGAMAGETWNCRNPDLEVSCSTGQCDALPAGDFTPMSVAFNDAGGLSACMYSGCWEGAGQVHRSARFLVILASDVVYSTDPEPGSMRQDLAILLDLEDNVALLNAGGYAQPLVCTPLPQ